MKIEDVSFIHFKSFPENFIKEKSGVKSNTVRLMDLFEFGDVCSKMGEIKYIGITNTADGESFIRELKDITTYESSDVRMIIFSW